MITNLSTIPIIRTATQLTLTKLRDKHTTPIEFATLIDRVSRLLLETTLGFLPVISGPIETPLETTQGYQLATKVSLLAVMRAGIGMVDAAREIFPQASVYALGIARDEKTAESRYYYDPTPHQKLDENWVVILDPMLATGGSACKAITYAKEHGATNIVFVCVVAAPEGLRAVHESHPDVKIVTAVIDRALDERKYIRPGLGDAGDRIYGT